MAASGAYAGSRLLSNNGLHLLAQVVRGFGRGGKLLQCPTANLDMSALRASRMLSVPHATSTDSDDAATAAEEDGEAPGIYFGFAQLMPTGHVYECVVSVGWSPFFQNKEKAIEAHLLAHSFDDDFYGEQLAVLLLGYMRPELDFTTLDALKEIIQQDIQYAHDRLSGEGPFADSGENLGRFRDPSTWPALLDEPQCLAVPKDETSADSSQDGADGAEGPPAAAAAAAAAAATAEEAKDA